MFEDFLKKSFNKVSLHSGRIKCAAAKWIFWVSAEICLYVMAFGDLLP